MILASMDRCTSFYRICDANGDVYPSAQTRLHRPDNNEGCFAACDHRFQLNDDYHDYDLSTTDAEIVCRRCVPQSRQTPPDTKWVGVRADGAHSVLIPRHLKE